MNSTLPILMELEPENLSENTLEHESVDTQEIHEVLLVENSDNKESDPLIVNIDEEESDSEAPDLPLINGDFSIRKLRQDHPVFQAPMFFKPATKNKIWQELSKLHPPLLAHISRMSLEELLNFQKVILGNVSTTKYQVPPREPWYGICLHYLTKHRRSPLTSFLKDKKRFQRLSIPYTSRDPRDPSVVVHPESSREQLIMEFNVYVNGHVIKRLKIDTLTQEQLKVKLEEALKMEHPIHKIIETLDPEVMKALICYCGDYSKAFDSTRSTSLHDDLAECVFKAKPQCPVSFLQQILTKYKCDYPEGHEKALQELTPTAVQLIVIPEKPTMPMTVEDEMLGSNGSIEPPSSVPETQQVIIEPLEERRNQPNLPKNDRQTEESREKEIVIEEIAIECKDNGQWTEPTSFDEDYSVHIPIDLPRKKTVELCERWEMYMHTYVGKQTSTKHHIKRMTAHLKAKHPIRKFIPKLSLPLLKKLYAKCHPHVNHSLISFDENNANLHHDIANYYFKSFFISPLKSMLSDLKKIDPNSEIIGQIEKVVANSSEKAAIQKNALPPKDQNQPSSAPKKRSLPPLIPIASETVEEDTAQHESIEVKEELIDETVNNQSAKVERFKKRDPIDPSVVVNPETPKEQLVAELRHYGFSMLQFENQSEEYMRHKLHSFLKSNHPIQKVIGKLGLDAMYAMICHCGNTWQVFCEYQPNGRKRKAQHKKWDTRKWHPILANLIFQNQPVSPLAYLTKMKNEYKSPEQIQKALEKFRAQAEELDKGFIKETRQIFPIDMARIRDMVKEKRAKHESIEIKEELITETNDKSPRKRPLSPMSYQKAKKMRPLVPTCKQYIYEGNLYFPSRGIQPNFLKEARICIPKLRQTKITASNGQAIDVILENDILYGVSDDRNKT